MGHGVLTIETKHEIIDQLAKGMSGSSLAMCYNIGKVTVSDRKRNKKRQFFNVQLNFILKIILKEEACTSDTAIEGALFTWFAQKQSLGESLSSPLLCLKALPLKQKIAGNSNFKVSADCIKPFASTH